MSQLFKENLHKLKNLLPFLNFIVLIILLVLGIYSFNKYKNLDAKINSLNTSSNGKATSQDDQTSTGKSADGYLEYINSFQKVKMKYPEDWAKTEYDNLVFAEFKKDPNWDFNIFAENLTSNPTLEEYKTKVLNGIKDYKNYKFIDSQNTTLANLPSFTLTFLATFNKDYKIKQIYTVRQNHGYGLTYRSSPDQFDKALKEADKMFSSFEILTD